MTLALKPKLFHTNHILGTKDGEESVSSEESEFCFGVVHFSQELKLLIAAPYDHLSIKSPCSLTGREYSVAWTLESAFSLYLCFLACKGDNATYFSAL